MENKIKKVALYVRVSTDEQVKNGNWLDVQINSLKNYVKSKEDAWYYTDDKLLYIDDWYSWILEVEQRPALERLINDIKLWRVDVVVVKKIDRMARKVSVLLNIVEENFLNRNIEFVSTDDWINTEWYMGKFFLTLLGAFAEMERQLISERTMNGKISSITEKWHFPFWNPPFWYVKNIITKKLEINEEQSNFVKRLFVLYAEDKLPIPEIKEKLVKEWFSNLFWEKQQEKNKWRIDDKFLYKILWNDAYINNFYLNKYSNKRDKYKKLTRVLKPENEWLKYELTPIIDEDLFNSAQKIININKKKYNNNWKNVMSHLFAWLTECGECGSSYITTRALKKWIHYNYCICTKKWNKYWSDKCTNHQISEIELKWKVFDELKKIINDPNLYLEDIINDDSNKNLVENLLNEINNLLDKKEKVKKELEKILKLLLLEENDDSLKFLNDRKLENENIIKNIMQLIKEKRDEVNKLENEESDKKDIIEFYNKLKWINIDNLTIEEQKEILSILISKIIIHKNRVIIWLKYIKNYNKDNIGGYSHKKGDYLKGKNNKSNSLNALVNSTIYDN